MGHSWGCWRRLTAGGEVIAPDCEASLLGLQLAAFLVRVFGRVLGLRHGLSVAAHLTRGQGERLENIFKERVQGSSGAKDEPIFNAHMCEATDALGIII